MFGDWEWDSTRTDAQEAKLEEWLQAIESLRLVIVECGAGKGVPTVRQFCERMAIAAAVPLIRINVRESDVPEGQVSIALGALEALKAIDRLQATVQHGITSTGPLNFSYLVLSCARTMLTATGT
jgi:hypothetical protein